MNITFQRDFSNIDWTIVPEILKAGEMGFHDPSDHQKAFENSASVVFAFDKDQLIGFGRAISDKVYQAALYDVAILPEYQRRGIGKRIIQTLVDSLPGCNFILYASPGKEPFYQKLNFRKMKTGMALFVNAQKMIEKGMIE